MLAFVGMDRVGGVTFLLNLLLYLTLDGLSMWDQDQLVSEFKLWCRILKVRWKVRVLKIDTSTCPICLCALRIVSLTSFMVFPF